MKTQRVTINLPQKTTYPIFIGENILSDLNILCKLDSYSKIFIVTDTILEKILVKKIIENIPETVHVITITPGEKEKSITSIQTIWNELLKNKADRKSLVINIGGGVITDMGGFAASTYMRGLDFINIPTSLLAQVDASVGGKTGVNFGGYKNAIGTFNQPCGVVIDIQTLHTLPKREYISGFAEIIKHGIIADKSYFDFVTSKKPQIFLPNEMIDIINGSCRIKAAIIIEDPREQGKRKLINFGHTIGHAIEAISLDTNKPLFHGEAISVGMIVESKVAVIKGLLSKNDFQTIKQALMYAELPTAINDISSKEIIEKIQHDKKSEKGILQWTLIRSIGEGVINQVVEDEIIEKALEEVLI